MSEFEQISLPLRELDMHTLLDRGENRKKLVAE